MPLETKNILEAIKEAKDKSKKRKFTQSIELIINLRDVNPKKPQEKIQELIELPHPPGKENRICVIASGEMALKAKRAKADLVIEKGELGAMMGDKEKQKELAKSYDFFIAEAPLMPLVGKILGATLGPKGKMPTHVPPTAKIAAHMKRHRKMVLLRTRGQPVLQCRVGAENMSDEKIAENVQAVIGRVEAKLKRGLKNISSVSLKTTMGPSIKIRM
ncbi:MAG: 50S ribosomal protein L1 [Candidatus Bathyarchaeota archaeon]|nr:50S ribosomal protein L1 [Candidatus Bathyarchaeota archaeon]MDH5532169.1 50S ribosomal protein L1 [Candidatus Bathyarchaeota archaeon]MDH5712575.1 50S ribosomal protein L1 [Candidatus Bathyarchaeota archaeon]